MPFVSVLLEAAVASSQSSSEEVSSESSLLSYLLPVAVGLAVFLYFMATGQPVPTAAHSHGGASGSTRKPDTFDKDKSFTAEELKNYDGKKNPSGSILLACKGVVYDVTAGASFYGPEGPYGVFSGRDASRALAKMDLQEQRSNVEDLTPAEKQTLNEWAAKFSTKYPVVGRLAETVSNVTASSSSL